MCSYNRYLQNTLVIICTCFVDLYFRLKKSLAVSLGVGTLKSPKMTFGYVFKKALVIISTCFVDL